MENLVGVNALHHVGVTVSDISAAATFWASILGVEPLWRRRLDGPYLSEITGYSGIEIEAAMLPLPGGGHMELLEYQTEDKASNPDSTANPGNVHICVLTDDIEGMFARAVALGCRPVSKQPIPVSEGPNAGAVACYLRAPDGVTLEFFQRPPSRAEG